MKTVFKIQLSLIFVHTKIIPILSFTPVCTIQSHSSGLYTKFRSDWDLLKTNLSHVGPLVLYLDRHETPEYLSHLAVLRYLPHLHDIDENALEGLTQVSLSMQGVPGGKGVTLANDSPICSEMKVFCYDFPLPTTDKLQERYGTEVLLYHTVSHLLSQYFSYFG